MCDVQEWSSVVSAAATASAVIAALGIAVYQDWNRNREQQAEELKRKEQELRAARLLALSLRFTLEDAVAKLQFVATSMNGLADISSNEEMIKVAKWIDARLNWIAPGPTSTDINKLLPLANDVAENLGVGYAALKLLRFQFAALLHKRPRGELAKDLSLSYQLQTLLAPFTLAQFHLSLAQQAVEREPVPEGIRLPAPLPRPTTM